MPIPSINIPSALLLLGFAQNIVFAFALFRIKKGNRAANRILAGLLLVFSITLIDGFLSNMHYYFKYPYLARLESPFIFLLGPLVYFYVIALTAPGGFVLKWGLLMHLIPFGMKAVLSIPFYLLPANEKVRVLTAAIDKLGKHSSISLDPFLLILVTQFAAYLIASLRLIIGYSTRIKTGFSSLAKINLSWLRDLYIALFILWCAFSFASVYAPQFGYYFESMTAIRLMIALLILVMCVRGLIRPQVFNASDVLLEVEGTQPIDANRIAGGMQQSLQLEEKEKYRKSSLSDVQAADILRRLAEIMEKERPFLDPELTLPELSKKLSVTPNHLSQVINGRLKKTFFDYINEYRVEEAKRLLISPASSHLSILGIATDAGFHSKNAFYQAFKKNTGINPSKFREQSAQAKQTEKDTTPKADGLASSD